MKNQLKQLQAICKKCYSERKELNIEEMPKGIKEDLQELRKEFPELESSTFKFFQCVKCNEVSFSVL